MQDLIITLIQSDLYWHNTEANLGMFEEKIWSIGEQTDMIILPEMFNSGFTMDVQKMAEPMNGRTYRWMKQQAAQTGAVIVGSVIISEKNQYFNRLLWMKPDGTCDFYDKKHLFRMVKEHETFTAGNTRLIQKIKDWKICPLTCYDLRFPVWSMNSFNHQTQSLDYDVLIYIANWPEARINAWDTLITARAIENYSYVVGVNRVGKDGTGTTYNGHSIVVNPKGRRLFFSEDKEAIRTLSFDFEKIKEFRGKFPAYLDNDHFEIK